MAEHDTDREHLETELTEDDAGEVEACDAAGDEPADAASAVEQERDEFRDKYQRALADYQNYQRRALNNEREAKSAGMRTVVESVIGVVDHFDLALNQDPEKASAEQILGGVQVIRDELFKALAGHGVATIEPSPNDEFAPGEHEAVMQQAAEGIEGGRVSMMLQVGYRLGDRVVRPAKVAVAPQD
ncbi:MAG: nucleotide exchange factor GrpE [Planctomycetota bacterium]